MNTYPGLSEEGSRAALTSEKDVILSLFIRADMAGGQRVGNRLGPFNASFVRCNKDVRILVRYSIAVAIGLLLGCLVRTGPAHAGPDACTVEGATATCTGDQSDGIAVGFDFFSPPVTTLNVNTLDPTGITPPTGISGVDFIAANPDVLAVSIDSITSAGINVFGPAARGILVENTGTGGVSVENSAVISSEGNSIEARTNGPDADVRVTNSGSLFSLGADGIVGVAAGDGNIVIENSGDIEAIFGGILADGFGTNSDIFIDNSGTITRAGRAAIEAATLGNITIRNTATLDGTRPGGTVGDEGILVRGVGPVSRITITNSGDITAFNNGIDADGPSDTRIFNSGDIQVSLGAAIQGVGADRITIENSGVLTGFGEETVSGGITLVAAAEGVIAETRNDGGEIIINNSGTILSELQSGIVASHQDVGTTSIVNTGRISGDTGIFLFGGANPGATSSVINSGLIEGTGGVAIDFRGQSSDTLTLLPGSRISGSIDFGAGNDGAGGTDPDDIDTFNVGFGVNADLAFADRSGTDSALQSAPEFINFTGAGAVINNGTGLIAVDATGFAAQGGAISTLTELVLNSLAEPLTAKSPFDGGTQGVSSTHDFRGQGLSSQPLRLRAAVFGGGSEVSAERNLVTYRNNFAGFTTAAETGLRDRHGVFGALAGYGKSDISIASDIGRGDVEAFFGGLYWQRSFARFDIQSALIGGLTDHETTRNLGGATARGDFDGWFYAPSVTLSAPLKLIGKPLVLSGRATYVGGRFDDYSESGAANPLTVASRNISFVNLRPEISLPLEMTGFHDSTLRLEGRIGLDVSLDAGSEDVSVIAAGVPFSFSADTPDIVSGLVGFSVRQTSRDERFSVSFKAELLTDFDGGYRASGQLAASIRF
ncbi:MAG: autotransporter domain-containing protein [Pseudomonadota bacterium]